MQTNDATSLKLRDPTLLTSKCYLGGVWRGEPTWSVCNPATGDLLGRVPMFGAVEATEAVEAAAEAFVTWSTKLAKERSQILRRWFELIIANKDDLALLLTSEQGKPLVEAKGEIEYAASFVEFYAEEAKRVYGETVPTHRADARIIVIRQPIGVVAAITPWNFPAAMITRKVAPSLAAGCTVVLKPAPETPLTALALALLADRAGFPPGVLNFITGDAPAIGEVLTSHQAVKFVGFTGSTKVGKHLMQRAATSVKRVGMELGGNAPFIVFNDADVDAAIEGAMVSKFRNMGQTCICANRIFVQDDIYDQFVDGLSKRVARLKVGVGTEVGVEQGPLINGAALDKLRRHIADAVEGGAKIEVGGRAHELGGTFFQPTVLSGVTTQMAVSKDEIFGPLAPIYRFADEADVIAQANATEYGLASYFYTSNLGRVFRVAEALDHGMVGINTGHISTELAPFGGVKESGIGREGSRHGIDEFLVIKYVLIGGLN